MKDQPSTPFEMSPMLKMYAQSFEAWKNNYETFLKNATDMQGAFGANGPAGNLSQPAGGGASPHDAALLNWQKTGAELFKRFVQTQIDLCNFFGSRWEQYLKLPEQITQCRSMTELGNIQTSFLSQFASDYMHETQKLAQPVAEAMTNWPGEKKA